MDSHEVEDQDTSRVSFGDLEARYRDFQDLGHYGHSLKLSCEIGAVTEDLLPRGLTVAFTNKITAKQRKLDEHPITNEWC